MIDIKAFGIFYGLIFLSFGLALVLAKWIKELSDEWWVFVILGLVLISIAAYQINKERKKNDE